jgi:anti-anti-sigma regulatory factor
VLERVMDKKGVLAFCNLTPTIDKTFRIMGLAQYASIYPTEEEALQAVSARV